MQQCIYFLQKVNGQSKIRHFKNNIFSKFQFFIQICDALKCVRNSMGKRAIQILCFLHPKAKYKLLLYFVFWCRKVKREGPPKLPDSDL